VAVKLPGKLQELPPVMALLNRYNAQQTHPLGTNRAWQPTRRSGTLEHPQRMMIAQTVPTRNGRPLGCPQPF
jgi:hypothetical protein